MNSRPYKNRLAQLWPTITRISCYKKKKKIDQPNNLQAAEQSGTGTNSMAIVLVKVTHVISHSVDRDQCLSFLNSFLFCQKVVVFSLRHGCMHTVTSPSHAKQQSAVIYSMCSANACFLNWFCKYTTNWVNYDCELAVNHLLKVSSRVN